MIVVLAIFIVLCCVAGAGGAYWVFFRTNPDMYDSMDDDTAYQAMADDDESLDSSYIKLNESQGYPSFRVNGGSMRAGSGKRSLLDNAMMSDNAESYSSNASRGRNGNMESTTFL